jgi:hypothetical protein
VPIRKLILKPGVDVEESPTLNAAQITASNLIRFYSGLPQKRAGWAAMNTVPLIGTASGLHGWTDIVGNPYLAAGTEQRLEVLIGGELFDITPLDVTTNPVVAFTTVIGTSSVTILDASNNPSANDWINLTTHVAVGGLVLYGYYLVTGVVDATHYTIDAGENATASVAAGGAVSLYTTANTFATVTVTLAAHGLTTSDTYYAGVSTTVATVVISGLYAVTSVTDANNFVITAATNANANASVSENAGDAQIEYLLPSGYAMDTGLNGYGIGDYGADDYGVGSDAQATFPMRQWSLDNYGQDLIASPTGGAIYMWEPAAIVPASVVSGSAPIYNNAVFVMSQAQIVVALGAEVSSTQEPLLVRWSDAGDFTAWTPTATNQAGSYFISQGSKLVGGIATGLGALLWTDVGLYSMTYQGLPFVFSFRPLATGCGLIGMRAAAVVGSLVMWLSNHGFFVMPLGGGTPTPIECAVWDVMTNNWDLGQPGQFIMAPNTLANEFELFFPIASSSPYYVEGSVTRGSIKYNFVEKVWDYTISSQLQRTAWQGHWATTGGSSGNPVGSDLTGLLQQHEVGFDADGAPMIWSWTTGYFDLAEGEEMIFIDWLIPDFTSTGSPTISISLLVQGYPNQDEVTVGPFQVSPSTWAVPPFGARGRQAAIQVSGSDLNTFNRLGALRYRFAADGRGF